MALITVSGHLLDPSGAATAGSVVFQLTNYGANIPRVIGTNAVVATTVVFTANGSGAWSGSIQGNDTIDPGASNTPPTTYYIVSFRDVAANVIRSLPFNFTGAGPANLDSQAPLNPIPQTSVPNNAGLLAANQTWTGVNTFTGANVISAQSIESVLYADQFSGSDIGAQINAAYTALPSAPSCGIIMLPSGNFNFSTPVTFATVGKYCILQGRGSSQQSSNVGGTVLNYTPTTATAAITIDWTPAASGGFAPGAGLRDFTLTNGNPFNATVGGTGSSATGINIGPTNSGAEMGEFRNLRVEGFGTGVAVPDAGGQSWGMTFYNCSIAYNNTGVSFSKTEEQTAFLNSRILLNGIGINYANAASGDTTFVAGSIDSNTTMGVEFNASGVTFNAIGTHWEWNVAGNVLFTHGTANVLNICGGQAQNDNTTGTSASWFDSSKICATGVTLWSAGTTQSDFVFKVRSAGHISIFNNAPSVISNSEIVFIGNPTVTSLDITCTTTANQLTTGIVTLAGGAAPTVAASQVGFGSTTATSATAGSNGDVPAQVVGYLIINVAGTNQKIPYYAV